MKFEATGSNTVISDLASGHVQFASTDAINILQDLLQGEKLVSYLPLQVGFTESIIMSKSAYKAAGLTASSTVKEKIRALANKPLGVISIAGENGILFKYMFHYAGVPISELHMVQVGSAEATLAALKSGHVAAVNPGAPLPAEAVQGGYATYLFKAPLSAIPPLGTDVSQVLATTASYASSHAALLTRLRNAYVKALKVMEAHPTATALSVYKQYFAATESRALFLSTFKAVYGVIAKTTTISSAQEDAVGAIAKGAQLKIPSSWRTFFQKS